MQNAWWLLLNPFLTLEVGTTGVVPANTDELTRRVVRLMYDAAQTIKKDQTANHYSLLSRLLKDLRRCGGFLGEVADWESAVTSVRGFFREMPLVLESRWAHLFTDHGMEPTSLDGWLVQAFFPHLSVVGLATPRNPPLEAIRASRAFRNLIVGWRFLRDQHELLQTADLQRRVTATFERELFAPHPAEERLLTLFFPYDATGGFTFADPVKAPEPGKKYVVRQMSARYIRVNGDYLPVIFDIRHKTLRSFWLKLNLGDRQIHDAVACRLLFLNQHDFERCWPKLRPLLASAPVKLDHGQRKDRNDNPSSSSHRVRDTLWSGVPQWRMPPDNVQTGPFELDIRTAASYMNGESSLTSENHHSYKMRQLFLPRGDGRGCLFERLFPAKLHLKITDELMCEQTIHTLLQTAVEFFSQDMWSAMNHIEGLRQIFAKHPDAWHRSGRYTTARGHF